MRRPDVGSQRGSVTVELVILAPLVGLLLAALVTFGRVESARAEVEAVSRLMAREISLDRDPGAAVGAAEAGARRALDVGSARCRSVRFSVSVGAESVGVRISCVIDLSDAGVLPFPGHLEATGRANEVVDRHREDG